MIRVLHRALSVLEQLAREGERPVALGELAAATGLNPATCARVLRTLVRAGYVDQEGPRKGYRLGPMAYALAAGGPYRKELVACSEAAVNELARATGDTALVAILHQNMRFLLFRAEGGHDVQVRSDTVTRGDVYSAATGRLLMAHLPPEARDAMIEQIGLPDAVVWPGAQTRQKLLKELEALKALSMVIVTTNAHYVAIAKPLRQAGQVVAALGLYLPASRYSASHKAIILKAMDAAAIAIHARVAALHAPRLHA